MAKQAERREATRSRLIEAARAQFAAAGYEDTHTGDILKQAGVSRGAMYHHFPSKKDVFEAVFTAVSQAAVAASARAGDRDAPPVETLVKACMAWLAEARQPETAAILLDQGPQVLGWKRARDLEEAASLGVMKAGLGRAVDAGELDLPSLDLAARVLNAVVAELALAAAHRPDAVSPAEQEHVIRRVLAGFGASPQSHTPSS